MYIQVKVMEIVCIHKKFFHLSLSYSFLYLHGREVKPSMWWTINKKAMAQNSFSQTLQYSFDHFCKHQFVSFCIHHGWYRRFHYLGAADFLRCWRDKTKGVIEVTPLILQILPMILIGFAFMKNIIYFCFILFIW